MRATTKTLAVSLLLSLAACAGETAAPGEPPAPTIDEPGGSGGKADDVVPSGDWRARVAAEHERLVRERPELVAELTAALPTPTRAGHLRLTVGTIDDADAATLLLHRLMVGERDGEVRAALLEALPRTGGVFADALLDLAAAEPLARTRAVAMAIGWRVPASVALPLLQAGMKDADAEVRAEAVRTVARHPDGARLAADVAALLDDDADQVRAAAARTAGLIGDGGSAKLEPLVGDLDAEVRLAALRAIRRADPAKASALATARGLDRDPDPRIRAAVR